MPPGGTTVLSHRAPQAGGSGFLGTELGRRAASAGQLVAATFATMPGDAAGIWRHALDLRDAGRIEPAMNGERFVGGSRHHQPVGACRVS